MNGEFVAAMEDVLDLYADPYDPDRPVVCFDETSTSARGGLADVREPLPAEPRRPRRQSLPRTGYGDYEYLRGGTRNLFLFCEPRAGWRHIAIIQRSTMQDFAHQMQWLVDTAYPNSPVIRVVLDNLNTHRMASLYETFPAVEARRIVKRLEFHHTPKHASWLNPVLSLPKGWWRSNSARSAEPVSRGETPTPTPWNAPLRPTKRGATPRPSPSTGGSVPTAPEPNSNASIPAFPTLTEY